MQTDSSLNGLSVFKITKNHSFKANFITACLFAASGLINDCYAMPIVIPVAQSDQVLS